MAKKRSASSGAWLREHFDDHYVKQAQREGYRSRACYKLLEIQEKDRILRPGMSVLDLGAAPGGWSQVAAKFVGNNGKVIASDILPIEEIAGVTFLQGDFTEQSVYDDLTEFTDGARFNVVLSDMAPNMSGQLSVDQPKSMHLADLAIDMAIKTLEKNGSFIVKVFQGEGFDAYVQNARNSFKKVTVIKSKASRPRSKEVYLLASQLK